MLRNASNHRRAGLGFASLALLVACNQAGVDNSAPRLDSAIPSQSLAGGAQLSLDLATFVSDRETAAANLTYTVLGGGGTITGTTYTHTFDTIGTYTVTVRVTDPAGKSLDISFDVDVTSANLAVMTTGNDLRLLDTDSLTSRPLATGGGFAITYQGRLTRGCVVYGRDVGSNQDLHLYDARTTRTLQLLAGDDAGESFAGVVGADRVLFRVTRGSSVSLWMYDARTGATVALSNVDGETTSIPVVDGTRAVFFRRTAGGQGDLFRYDLSSGQTTTVAAAATDEVVERALPSGAILFTRVGGSGEVDLFYWRSDLGAVEVGGDVAGIANLNKAAGFVNADDSVLFTANNGGQLDVYVWRAGEGTTVLAATGDSESPVAVLPTGHFLFDVNTGGTDRNLRLFDVTARLVRNFPASAVDDVFVGNLTDGRVLYTKDTANGVHLFLATYAAGVVNEVAVANTNGQSYALAKVLANDKVVFHVVGGGLGLYNPANASTVSAAAGARFVAEMPTVGDFVFKFTNAAQFDLALWDDSAAATVAVGTGGTDEEDAVGLSNGRILFSRKIANSTARELFAWRPDLTVTQVTDDGVDHQVVATFAASVQ